MTTRKLFGATFYGNEASEYAKKQGYLDYDTFAKAFDSVLNNDIIAKTQEIGYWEQENGFIDNSEEIADLEEKLSDLNDELLILDDEETEEINRINSEIEKVQERIEALREEEDSYNQEIYQYFIVSNSGAEIIKEWTNDPLFYNEELDMYVWGITHFGTSWDYVLTDIRLNCGKEEFE